MAKLTKKQLIQDIRTKAISVNKKIANTRKDALKGGLSMSTKALDEYTSKFAKITGNVRQDKLYVGNLQKLNKGQLRTLGSLISKFESSPHFDRKKRKEIERKTLESMKLSGRAKTLKDVRRIQQAFANFENDTGFIGELRDRNLLSSEQVIDVYSKHTLSEIDNAIENITDPLYGLDLISGRRNTGVYRSIIVEAMSSSKKPISNNLTILEKVADIANRQNAYTLSNNEIARLAMIKNYREKAVNSDGSLVYRNLQELEKDLQKYKVMR